MRVVAAAQLRLSRCSGNGDSVCNGRSIVVGLAYERFGKFYFHEPIRHSSRNCASADSTRFFETIFGCNGGLRCLPARNGPGSKPGTGGTFG